MTSPTLGRYELAPPGFPALRLDAAESTGPSAACGNCVGDVEELHRVAVTRGERSYIDPRSGYTVFTQLAALKRGKCCGSGCRHCPYSHDRVPAARKARLPPPIVEIR